MSLNIRTPDPNQAKVYDIADPDRHAEIIGAGSQQSEIRFDDGTVRIVPNDHLRSVVETSVDVELDNPTHPESPEIVTVRHGQEAWCLLRAGFDLVRLGCSRCGACYRPHHGNARRPHQ